MQRGERDLIHSLPLRQLNVAERDRRLPIGIQLHTVLLAPLFAFDLAQFPAGLCRPAGDIFRPLPHQLTVLEQPYIVHT